MIVEVYEEFDPDKLPEVERLLQEYDGYHKELSEKISNKHMVVSRKRTSDSAQLVSRERSGSRVYPPGSRPIQEGHLREIKLLLPIVGPCSSAERQPAEPPRRRQCNRLRRPDRIQGLGAEQITASCRRYLWRLPEECGCCLQVVASLSCWISRSLWDDITC